ncbi:insulinase family protein [Candidatus Binatia bacterium]|nr:insulinase family protein [Candidatus Binatia bacterium]
MISAARRVRRLLPSLAGVALAVTVLASPAHAAGPLVERTTLGNGIRLVLSQQRSVPIVAINCIIDGGARVDPPGKAGLANLTGSLLSEGTKGRTSEEISRLIDSLGGSFDTGTSSDWVLASAAVLSRDFATGVDLIARSLREPTFPPEEVERRKKETLGELEADEDEPGLVAQRAFRKALFGTAAYGSPVDGTPESVKSLTRDDVVAYHRDEIQPSRTICAIVGDVPTTEMKSTVERLLGDWQGSGKPLDAKAANVPPARSVVVDRPVTQASVVLGQIGVARSNPDYFPILLMNWVLGGGGFNSRLMQSIRTKSGLAYSVASAFESSKLPGAFQVALQTKVESAAQAIEMVRAEIKKLHDEGATEAELVAAKDYLTGNFPLRLDSTGKLAGFLGQVEYFGLGDDYIERYAERVRAVSLDDVKRAAAKYLQPDALVQVVVGPASKLAEQGITPTPGTAVGVAAPAAAPAGGATAAGAAADR